MKFLNIIFLVFLIVGCNNNSYLDAYDCDSSTSVSVCKGKCKLKDDIKLSFKTNKEDRKVMMIVYERDTKKTTGSIVIDNCTVFDDKNWSCSSTSDGKKNAYLSTDKMTNGIFASEKNYVNLISLENVSSQLMCAE